MIFLIVTAILLSVFVVWMVTQPLFSAQNMDNFSASYKGFSDENELKQVLQLRDLLLARLVFGESNEERISVLSESDCFQALVSVSLRLQRAELPYLPESKIVTKGSSESGRIQFGVIIFISSLFVGAGLALSPSVTKAQEEVSPSTSQHQQPSSAPQIAPLHLIEPGIYVPQVNRYMVSPGQGFALAHHLTAFSIPSDVVSEVTVVLPVPQTFTDWQLLAVRPESLQKQVVVESWHGQPALKVPSGTQGLVVDVNSEFRLEAFSGQVVWRNSKFPDLPGEQVAILLEADGIIRRILGPLVERWNIWPPRFVPVGEGLKVMSREVAMNPEMPPRRVQILSRQSEAQQPYIHFEIVGLPPNRLPLIILGALVGASLLGVALVVFVRSVRWRIDSSPSLPG